jgi:hypothetical protein
MPWLKAMCSFAFSWRISNLPGFSKARSSWLAEPRSKKILAPSGISTPDISTGFLAILRQAITDESNRSIS